MKLKFTDHAQYRIFYERGISAEDIKLVIEYPDRSEKLQEGLIKSRKFLDKGNLVVIYSVSNTDYLIITSYFK